VLLTDRIAGRYFLPGWVYQGALAVAFGGLALLLLVALSQNRFRSGEGGGVSQAGLRRWLTPRRALSGIAAALAVVGMSAGVYVGSRALGIGPAAPLIARGILEEREPIVLTDFVNQTQDTLLGSAVTEALRVDLARSPVVHVVESDDIKQVLARMERDPKQPLDVALGREVAVREGIRAVIGGEIHLLGATYVLSIRLVAADTGEELFAARETAEGAGSIIDAIDQLSRRLRERIGESLGSVGQSEPLPAITTSSLDALKAYARGIEVSRSGDPGPAMLFFRRAVTLDSAFAGAHRALAIYLDVSGDPAAAQVSAARAYRFSHRLPQREQALTRAAYHARFGRLDSTAYYYRLLLDSPRDSVTALNNLGDALERMGRYEEALPLYARAAEAAPHRAAGHANVASVARTLGQHELADSALTVLMERFPQSLATSIARIANAYYEYDLAAVEESADQWLLSIFPDARASGQQWLASLAAMSGRIERTLVLTDSAARTFLEDSRPALSHQALMLLEIAGAGAERSETALEYLLPFQDDLIGGDQVDTSTQFHYRLVGLFAHAFALAGEDRDARSLLTRMDSLVAVHGLQPTGIGEHVRAVLALSEGRPAASLQHLQRARAAEFGLLHVWSRFLLGQVYVALNRPQEAAAEFESLTTTRGLNYQDNRLHGAVRPLAHEQLGPLYLALGDTTSAMRHMAAFVELWEDADPDLQPRVEAVRERLESLLRVRG
jgi:tetratricopeptide (TPR) repeat protein